MQERKLRYEDIIEKKLEEFHKNDTHQATRFSVLTVYETKINNISPDFEYLNLKNLKKIKH